jgi:hypothetical protein
MTLTLPVALIVSAVLIGLPTLLGVHVLSRRISQAHFGKLTADDREWITLKIGEVQLSLMQEQRIVRADLEQIHTRLEYLEEMDRVYHPAPALPPLR